MASSEIYKHWDIRTISRGETWYAIAVWPGSARHPMRSRVGPQATDTTEGAAVEVVKALIDELPR